MIPDVVNITEAKVHDRYVLIPNMFCIAVYYSYICIWEEKQF